ncbi:MAG TPA: M15 family metallopeptidase [Oleiagrimonas sp.]|nr:M15 family metallopeptidase [Oleiagrimonas sp.]
MIEKAGSALSVAFGLRLHGVLMTGNARPARIVLFACVLILATGCAVAGTPSKVSPAKTMQAAGMVDIRSLVPDMAEDIKYAGHDNFTGAPVPGYRAAKCFLLKPAAKALARVEHALRQRHMRLKIWDCYRPARAVAAFVHWAHDLSDTSTKAAHYPRIPKSTLLDGYIAPVSNHTRGATVDLTLMRCHADGRHCRPLDMGTHFDMFDPRAHTDSKLVTAKQRANRQILLHAMAAQGFKNYPNEWWHYTLVMHPQPATLYDVPVQ